MQKKYKLFVTCDMSQPCNMSHFEKIDNSGMTCGVKSSNFGFIFEPRTNPLIFLHLFSGPLGGLFLVIFLEKKFKHHFLLY